MCSVATKLATGSGLESDVEGGHHGLMVDFMVDFMGIEWVWLNAQNIPEFNGYNLKMDI